MNDNERGKGQGVGGAPQGDGGTDTCVCPECGATARHDRGTPCLDMACPKCGTKMIGKSTTNISSLKHLMSNLIREDQIDGENYYIVPTVLIVEGVHNGSGGKTFYPSKELSKFPEAWDGRPIVIYHPEFQGRPVTASSPALVERQTIGNLYNTRFEGNKLKSESWIKIEKCKKLSPDIMIMLEKNLPIEVSTGLFTEDDMIEGQWNGEEYITTAFNYRPDHLALLPEGVGACSWEDGAGMPRVNKEEEGDGKVKESSIVTLVRKLANVVGIGEIEREEEPKMQEERGKKGGPDMDRKERVEALIKDEKCDWSKDDREFLTDLEDTLFEKVEKPVQNQKSDDEEASLEDSLKAEPKDDESDAAKVARKAYNEAISGKENLDEPKENEEDGKGKKDEVKPPKTAEEFINNAPSGIRETLTRAVDRDKKIKDDLVKALMDNKRNEFSKEQLEERSLEDLQKLVSLAKIDVDYSGQNPPVDNEDPDKVSDMPKMNWDKKEEK